MRRSLVHQVYPVYLLAVLAAVGALLFASTRVFRTVFYAEKTAELATVARMAANVLAPALSEAAAVPAAVSLLADGTSNRITVVDSRGRVLADTHADPVVAGDHSDRPEIVGALAEGTASAVRRSATTGERSMYVAVALQRPDGEPSAVARVAASIESIDRRANDALYSILLAATVIVTATAGLTFVVVQRIHRPLAVIGRAASRYASGDLTERIRVRAPSEISLVAETLNRMADALSETIAGITARRNELEAVLGGMVEGVIVVGADRRVGSINRAAELLFGVERGRVTGRSVIEALRNADVDRLVERVLDAGVSCEESIVLYGSDLAHVQVHATLLRGETGAGVLLVMNDITRLKRLEEIRRDFVANVSHELRTPVTSILASAETLRDGALGDPGASERFLGVIHSQANRLALIIEDLLSLSRLEAIEGEVPTSEVAVEEIVARAGQVCEHLARRKGVTIRGDHSGDAGARVNATLLEQALVNLIDNAVKYSPSGAVVLVSSRNAGGMLEVAVRDEGCGIPRKDLPRIFERFYRVDPARSRDVGGTGLGLAIVKHIALAHHGKITVQSVEGRGSTFLLAIPQGQHPAPGAAG